MPEAPAALVWRNVDEAALDAAAQRACRVTHKPLAAIVRRRTVIQRGGLTELLAFDALVAYSAESLARGFNRNRQDRIVR